MPLTDFRGTGHNSVVEVRLPPLELFDPEVQPLVSKYQKLIANHRAAGHALDAISAKLDAAAAADRAELADALGDGTATAKKLPTNTRTQKVEAEREAQKRLIAALEVAIVNAENEMLDGIAAVQPRQLAEAEQEMNDVLVEYEEAADALAAAHEKLSMKFRTRSFFRNFTPGDAVSYKGAVGNLLLPLTAPSGESYDFKRVHEALLQFAADTRTPPASRRPILRSANGQPLANALVGENHLDPARSVTVLTPADGLFIDPRADD